VSAAIAANPARRNLLLALSSLALGGCAVIAPPVRTTGAIIAPGYHESLTLSGRISVRYTQNGHDESLQGGFQWTQSAQLIELNLLSPLNQILLKIDLTPTAARLLEPGKPPRSAPDIDTLMLQTFGWTLPVGGMRGWLQGYSLDGGTPLPIAVPGLADAPAVSTRDGWKISYVSWQDEAEPPLTRPRRIDLQRSTAEFGDMAIRIVIDTWQAP
jgi:outer membrane lipoprotein LolB